MWFIKIRRSGLSEASQHVVQNATVLEVFDLHISIQSDLHLEGLASVGSHSQLLMNLQVALADVDVELLFASQA